MRGRTDTSHPGRARRRRYGQHFLTRREAVARVVSAIAPLPSDRFLEIGPGRGAITAPLLAAGARLLAVEIDPRFRALLLALPHAEERLALVEGDILAVNLPALLSARFGEEPARAVGNLPYAVASPAILRLLSLPGRITDLTVMVQREVADRILSPPGHREFGILTLLCALRAAPARLLDLPPECFTPPPEVHSTLLRLTARPSPLASPLEERAFEQAVKAAFSSRRKRIRNSLAAGLRFDPPRAEALLGAAGVDPLVRPEEVGLEGFLELARHLALRGGWPGAPDEGRGKVV